MKFTSDPIFLAITRKVAMGIVLNVNIVSSAFGYALDNSRMSANNVINRRFANNWLHILFAIAARYFSDNFPV